MTAATTYDVALIGGGLAGLSLAIQLGRQGHKVILFEREKYPFHKVCGEYISMEAWNFLNQLGVPLQNMQLPLIKKLQLTAPNGTVVNALLPLGAFGISRYKLDAIMASLAKEAGVTVMEGTRVEDVLYTGMFDIQYASETDRNKVMAKVCCGSWGKRSNLDVKWQRPFITSSRQKQNNYIGIKYHIQTTWPDDAIGLHNFKDGYCGISKIEDGKYCFCYLTTAANLKKQGTIEALEQNVLAQNPALRHILNNSTKVEGFPLAIAQISFSKKEQSRNHVLMLGDAAGMITPLCGNGMSMALHSSKIAAPLVDAYLKGNMLYMDFLKSYEQQWQQQFARRLATGRLLQEFFGSNTLSNLFVGLFRTFPFLASTTIKQTHGKPF